jgi:hypothetical protein
VTPEYRAIEDWPFIRRPDDFGKADPCSLKSAS